MNRILMLVLESFLVAVLFGSGTDAFVVDRRSAASERNSDDYPDYQLGVKYDEYPLNAIKLELSFRVFSSCPAAKARWCKLPGLFLIRIGVASRCTCCTADSAPIRRIWKNFGHDKAWNIKGGSFRSIRSVISGRRDFEVSRPPTAALARNLRELAIKALPGPISVWPDDRQSILGDFDGGVVSLAAVGVCRFPLFSFDNRTIRIITLGVVGKII
ncbi:hypothetical protein GEV33_007989 [Tenebrio molitor]|uniref:Uncharacterized protein n=1 Tax=Tenebrio molitor TaxID=7067 RepID=A0A8J6HJM1_TENMO|nr:hypothetical protein GEV33_007989 [Tenebrio molitor]